MRDFPDIAAFRVFMRGVQGRLPAAGTAGLRAACVLVEAAAKAELGHYQAAAGPFHAWPDLAAATQADRERHGFAANEPGLRTGQMRDSIGHVVIGHEAAVGSNDENLVYFEMGTRRQPPRSVLGMAALHQTSHAVDAISGHVAAVLAGQFSGTIKP